MILNWTIDILLYYDIWTKEFIIYRGLILMRVSGNYEIILNLKNIKFKYVKFTNLSQIGGVH